MREFEVPISEGPESVESIRMRIFSPEETPIDIGSLEREAFADLGDWSLIKDKEGYGMVYRIGTKDIKDNEGRDTLLVLYFAKPGLLITKEISDRKYEDFSETMKQVTYKLVLKSDKNVMTIASELPDWMRSELESILSKK